MAIQRTDGVSGAKKIMDLHLKLLLLAFLSNLL